MLVHLKAIGSGSPAAKALMTTRRFFGARALFAPTSATTTIASKQSRIVERIALCGHNEAGDFAVARAPTRQHASLRPSRDADRHSAPRASPASRHADRLLSARGVQRAQAVS